MSTPAKLFDFLIHFLKPHGWKRVSVLFGAYLIPQLTFLTVIFHQHEFQLTDYVVATYVINKIVVDFGVFISIYIFVKKVFKFNIFPFIFSLIYFLLIVINTGMYLFGNALLEKHHLALLEWYSIKSYFGMPFYTLLLTLLVTLTLIAITLKKTEHFEWNTLMKWTIITTILIFADIPKKVSKTRQSNERLDGVITKFRNEQLEYISPNPLIRLLKDVLAGDITTSYRIVNNPAEFKDLIEKYNLQIGKKNLQKLNLEPFNKVVLILIESFGLDLISSYNKKLKIPTTSFFSSPYITERTFKHYYTTTIPTLPAVSAIFSGHPHLELQEKTGYRNFVPKLLRKYGYTTIFLRSASKFYAHENLIFKNMGFEKIIAREDFFKRKHMRKYIYGWGLEDRLLYDELVKILKQYKDEKLFITVLGTDTHPLDGQRYYKYLKYPPLPQDFSKFYKRAAEFLKSIHHMDYDISRLFEKIKREGLFTNDTLIILTSDHGCPYNNVAKAIPGFPPTSLNRIPLVLLTPQQLPETNMTRVGSQIDFASTLFHLLNLPQQDGWWGVSLFAKKRKELKVSYHNDVLKITTESRTQSFNMKRPKTLEAQRMKNLFNTVITPAEQ